MVGSRWSQNDLLVLHFEWNDMEGGPLILSQLVPQRRLIVELDLGQ